MCVNKSGRTQNFLACHGKMGCYSQTLLYGDSHSTDFKKPKTLFSYAPIVHVMCVMKVCSVCKFVVGDDDDDDDFKETKGLFLFTDSLSKQ